ncbi:MAG: hypothetical protein ACK41E_04810 [Deinococcales bacterium]
MNPEAQFSPSSLAPLAFALPPVPLDAPIFQALSSALIRWDMLEADIESRNQFSGFAVLCTPQAVARAYFVDSRFAGVLAQVGQDPVQALSRESFLSLYMHREATISLYTLDRYAVKSLLEVTTWSKQFERTVPQASLTATMASCEQQNLTGQLLVLGLDWRGVLTYNMGSVVLASFEQVGKTLLGQEAQTRIALEATETGTQFALYSKNAFSTLDQDTILTESSYDELIRTWNEILNFCESRTDAARGKETWDNAFRQARLALVDTYPDLDPFLDNLRYIAGVLIISRPSTEVFEGLVATYLETLKLLSIPAPALFPLLTPIRDKHRRLWRAAGLEVVCPL